MQMKRYETSSIQEAMAMIKKEMGEDAVILSTNRKGSNFEVLAARDGQDGPPEQPFKMLEKAASQRKWIDNGERETGEIREAIDALFDIIGTGARRGGDHHSELYYRLIAGGMSRPAACRFTEMVRNDPGQDACEALKRALPGCKDRKRIRVLVGPTGAGKTTTLAKLAAESAFTDKCRTAIITTDTHRIAAAEQIKIYARIMDIPMAVAADPSAYKMAVERFSGCDVIYVDTPGRAYRDREALGALKKTLQACSDTEASLVLSMTSTREHLCKSAEQYGIFQSSSIIFTKLDECSQFGAMFDVVEKTGIPISYLTMGQNVPEDIEKATVERIAELITGR